MDWLFIDIPGPESIVPFCPFHKSFSNPALLITFVLLICCGGQFSLLECADSLIDVGHIRISGSERKRVSVACKVYVNHLSDMEKAVQS